VAVDTFTLERTGLPPLQFRGTALGSFRGNPVVYRDGKRESFAVALYMLTDGKYVGQVAYYNEHKKGTDHHAAFLARDRKEVADLFAKHDPGEYVPLPPAIPKYDKLRSIILGDLRLKYRAAVSGLYEAIGMVEKV
jgi:hypothetical protein